MLHRIRLGPPWQVTCTAGRTRHVRPFGRPRMLDPDERVWLVCDSVPGPAVVFVNGVRVAASEEGVRPIPADISNLLRLRNEVVVETGSGDSIGEVALEIRQHSDDGK